ncbi:MAG: cytochrome-c peroxidase [Planctomycetota bacterium]|jgi:cytochrome c peroxidase
MGIRKILTLIVVSCLTAVATLSAQLPAVPVPVENPITESKRILGKLLYWEEQLSSDNTVACGTCHVLGLGGVDPRVARNPGLDGRFYTIDDVFGSLGIPRRDADNLPVEDADYGFDPQVTGRASNPVVGSQWAPELFWDGRAGSEFLNPETGAVSISSGGAFESQLIGPIISAVEMGHEDRAWSEVTSKLGTVEPMALATDLPQDMVDALSAGQMYPDLFEAAFGDATITAERIAFSIATYERTLVPDQTPWDLYMGGDLEAMTESQVQGWEFFEQLECNICHVAPLFTNHSYRNIGLRPISEDSGRQGVTGLDEHRGQFKVPTLRNVGLKTNFMHTGTIRRLQDVVAFYMGDYTERFTDNIDPLVLQIDVPLPELGPLVDFMGNALTDARVANEEPPFDRPTLRSERLADYPTFVDCLSGPGLAPDPTAPLTIADCLDLYDADGDDDVDLHDLPAVIWSFSLD